MKKRTQRIIIFASLITVLALFAFFLKDILIPYVKMELNHDLDGAKELLTGKGVFGFLTVVLVEALQMVVIFIPAEFIQISSGMSYPFYIAILLCDAGICLGATIIYVLVRVFRFDNERFDEKERMIDRIAATRKKHRNTVLLLYFLFIMPFIPFGAICYYGSRRDLKYGCYILTVATGVIPSIVTSNLMGAATKYFLSRDLPLWLLVLIIAALAVLLFGILFLFLDRVYLKENDGTPDSVIYGAFFRFVHFIRKRRQRLTLDNSLLKDVKPPYVVLCNHESFYDFYYLKQLIPDVNPAFVVNRHYISMPVIRTLAKKAGFIPKRLFHTDMVTPVKILRAIRGGYPVAIFPEGRLSLTGVQNPIVEHSASFYQKLNADLVLVKISGAYFANPKWRSAFYPSDITVRVERVITAQEAKAMTEAALNEAIESALRYDESALAQNVYPQKNKAKGLQNVLFRCIDCGALYTLRGEGNTLTCTACGAAHTLNERYRFTDAPETIHAYYRRIADAERKELDRLHLETPVKTVIFREKGRYKTRDRGVCTLTREGFAYCSARERFLIGFDELPALPFSCNREFEVYRGDDLYYFYPTVDRAQCARWALSVDLIKEMHDEKTRI